MTHLKLADVFIIAFLAGISGEAFSEPYNRSIYNFKSYKPNTNLGYYTQKLCVGIDIDHIVSLKDAHESGGHSWSREQKAKFANDRINHVPACSSVNRSKGSSKPSDFLRKSRDGRGIDYEIVHFCNYLERYFHVKKTYGLSFSNNNARLFSKCSINLNKIK